MDDRYAVALIILLFVALAFFCLWFSRGPRYFVKRTVVTGPYIAIYIYDSDSIDSCDRIQCKKFRAQTSEQELDDCEKEMQAICDLLNKKSK